jgi:hypothetical protein
MRRLLGYALVLAVVNLLSQAGLFRLTGHLDLTFGPFAGLLLIPLFQASILVLASPAREGIGLAAAFGTMAIGAVCAAAVLVKVGDPRLWTSVVVGLLAASCFLAAACHLSAKGARRAPFLLACATAAFFVAEVLLGLLARLMAQIKAYSTVLVLLAIYAPLLVVTILVQLAVERAMRERCRAAGRMVDAAAFVTVAGALVVAGNYYHHPMVGEMWIPVVRLAELLVLAFLLLAGALFLRHDRGGHAETA